MNTLDKKDMDTQDTVPVLSDKDALSPAQIVPDDENKTHAAWLEEREMLIKTLSEIGLGKVQSKFFPEIADKLRAEVESDKEVQLAMVQMRKLLAREHILTGKIFATEKSIHHAYIPDRRTAAMMLTKLMFKLLVAIWARAYSVASPKEAKTMLLKQKNNAKRQRTDIVETRYHSPSDYFLASERYCRQTFDPTETDIKFLETTVKTLNAGLVDLRQKHESRTVSAPQMIMNVTLEEFWDSVYAVNAYLLPLESPLTMGAAGWGIAGTTFSSINHSCRPNATLLSWTSEAGVMFALRANRPIAAGEEITISYIPSHNWRPNTPMAQILTEHDTFPCVCASCQMIPLNVQVTPSSFEIDVETDNLLKETRSKATDNLLAKKDDEEKTRENQENDGKLLFKMFHTSVKYLAAQVIPKRSMDDVYAVLARTIGYATRAMTIHVQTPLPIDNMITIVRTVLRLIIENSLTRNCFANVLGGHYGISANVSLLYGVVTIFGIALSDVNIHNQLAELKSVLPDQCYTEKDTKLTMEGNLVDVIHTMLRVKWAFWDPKAAHKSLTNIAYDIRDHIIPTLCMDMERDFMVGLAVEKLMFGHVAEGAKEAPANVSLPDDGDELM